MDATPPKRRDRAGVLLVALCAVAAIYFTATTLVFSGIRPHGADSAGVEQRAFPRIHRAAASAGAEDGPHEREARTEATVRAAEIVETPGGPPASLPAEPAECLDDDEHCPGWAVRGECWSNEDFMRTSCRRSCGTCAPPSRLEACPTASTDVSRRDPSSEVNLEIINEQMRNLELLWVQPDGAEKRYWVIDAYGTFQTSTGKGDIWRLRMKTGDLAAEILVTASSGHQIHVVRPCLPEPQRAAVEYAERLDVELEGGADALAACDPWAQLSTREPVPGMHVACVLRPSARAPPGSHATLAVYAEAWTRHTRRSASVLPTAVLALPEAVETGEGVARLVMDRLQVVRRGPLHQPPALFSPAGVRLESWAQVSRHACVIVQEGGQWIWPPVEVGHTRTLWIDDGVAPRHVTLETRSLRPIAFSSPDFIREEEASLIVTRADGHMFRSGVALKTADAGHKDAEYRTSSQWSFPLWEDAIMPLNRRVQQLTRVPVSQAEQIQVLRYNHMEHYSAHHDFFDPGDYNGRDREGGYASNRMATVFFYLNQPVRGGQTAFPRAGKLPQPSDFLDCTIGLPVDPQYKAVLVFYSMLPNGEFDHCSLHAGCDVHEGVKWSANYWLWNTPRRGNPKAQAITGDLKEDFAAPASAGSEETVSAARGAHGSE